MTETGFPFIGTGATSETLWSKYFRELQDTGVADSPAGTGCKATVTGSSMVVSIAAGMAIVRGHGYINDATVTKTLTAAHATLDRVDRIVLRLDPSANTVLLAVVVGTPGSGLPSLTQTDTGTYEMPVAQVTVPHGATSIPTINVVDDRPFQGTRVGDWTTAKRPASPRLGQFGWNSTLSAYEGWNGSAWGPLVGAVAWTAITGKPATFPPAPHEQDWNSITGKPGTFPPATHQHEWDTLLDVPATFPPSTHSHSYASLTSKPASFPPSTHSHDATTLSNGDAWTVGWANGSERVRDHTPAGGGTFYAVWVGGDDKFCHNTSSRRYKENIRYGYRVDPGAILALQPVVYDRKATEGDDGELIPGNKDEFGLIAEDVAAVLPEIVQYKDGQVEGIRYDLLAVAMLDTIKGLHERIAVLEGKA